MALKHNILHRDGTEKVYQSPATSGQFLYYASRGDDIENGLIGKGTPMYIENPDGLDEVSTEVQFLEDIQLKDAYFFWENAVWGDSINCEVILPANVPFEQPNKQGNAAKNADGVIVNITTSPSPDETWVGTHILFSVDVPMVRFVNNFHIFGTNNIGTVLESSGVALIKRDLKLRMTYISGDTNSVPNHDIKLSAMIELFRKNTI